MNYMIEIESVGLDNIILKTAFNLKKMKICSVRIVATPDEDNNFFIIIDSENTRNFRLYFLELEKAQAAYEQIKAYLFAAE